LTYQNPSQSQQYYYYYYYFIKHNNSILVFFTTMVNFFSERIFLSVTLIALFLLSASTASVSPPSVVVVGAATVTSSSSDTLSKHDINGEEDTDRTTDLSHDGTRKKRLTEDTMCSNIREMEYAVRGKIVIAADKIADELKQQQQGKKYDFDHIVYTNIGNPQSVGQAPLTWPRQVMALVDLPPSVGVDHPIASELFPADAITRAREIQNALACKSSGAYSHSKGVRSFRNDVATFITKRDGGIATYPEDIYLTNGASAGIVNMLNILIADSTWYVLFKTLGL